MVTFLLVAGSLHKETSRSIGPEHPPRARVRVYQKEGAHPWGISEGSRRPAGGDDRGRSCERLQAASNFFLIGAGAGGCLCGRGDWERVRGLGQSQCMFHESVMHIK